MNEMLANGGNLKPIYLSYMQFRVSIVAQC